MSLLYLLSLIFTIQLSQAQLPRVSPPYNYAFTFPLPIPAVKVPLTTYTNPETNTPIDFYQIDIRPLTKSHFPNLQPANLVGYDGVVPGPTFRVQKGRETVVRFVNYGERDAAAHLHGGNTRAPWDGWAEDTIPAGYYKDYYYPGQLGARTLWYHDHAAMATTLNLYAGQSGVYIIEDPELEAELGLPGGEYDVPLVLNAHYFTEVGDISDEAAERTSVYGDTFSVNGQILPYFEVEPRKYRFRLLNAAASRNFNLTMRMDEDDAVLPFWVIASDSSYLSRPVETERLIISMAERWEIVVDFGSAAGKNITVGQSTLFADFDYEGSDRMMQFRVGSTVTSEAGNGPLPLILTEIPTPQTPSSATKTFTFSRRIGAPWTINGQSWGNPMSRVLENPKLGTVETWILKGAGGWSHPVHAHLIEFTLLERGIGDANQAPGRRYLEEYEKGALKDVATLGENEAVTILARFTPWAGVYTFHCHNSVHEDYAMMVAFNVSALADFGYDNVTSQLADPMDERFRARPYSSTDLDEVRDVILPGFAELHAYPDVAEIESRLEEYWETKTRTGEETSTAQSSSSVADSSTTDSSSPSSTPASSSSVPASSSDAESSSPTSTPQSSVSSDDVTSSITATTQVTVSTSSTRPQSTVTIIPSTRPSTTQSTTQSTRFFPLPTPRPTTRPKPRPALQSLYPRCGPLFGGRGCPASECCSRYGWCGSSPEHCKKDNGCYSGCRG